MVSAAMNKALWSVGAKAREGVAPKNRKRVKKAPASRNRNRK